MNGLNDLYFEWLRNLSGSPRGRLLLHLYDTPFTYTIPMDSNRESDGIDLRYRYGAQNGIAQPVIASELDDKPCSVLEMMLALCLRLDETIVGSDAESQTPYIFSCMLESLGFSKRYSYFETEAILKRFFERNYQPNGKGGLFTLYDVPDDLRNVEIWYQAMWWLDERY